MPKRSSSDLASAADSSSDATPSQLAHQSEGNAKPSKKAKHSDKATPATRDQSRPRAWSADEEAVFLEVMERMCVSGLWQEIKLDGRVAHRGSSGTRAHIIALFRRLRK